MMHDELRRQCRIAAGRRPEPTAAIIDSQSVKAAETVSKNSRGFDAGKKVQGRKRHIAVDTIGLLLTVLVTAAGVQDRDGARPLLWNLRKAFRTVQQAWADSGYASGSRRTGAALPLARTARRAREGMTGAMGCAVTAASPGGGGAGTARCGREARLRVRAMSDLGEISLVWVSEGRLHQKAHAC